MTCACKFQFSEEGEDEAIIASQWTSLFVMQFISRGIAIIAGFLGIIPSLKRTCLPYFYFSLFYSV